MGIFYLDMGRGIAYNKTKTKELAAAAVKKYNEKHLRHINLYRVRVEKPGNVSEWFPGDELQLHTYVHEVPISEE